MSSGPLSDIRVLDFSQQYPGPLCTLLLSEFGADIWKVEPPAGDPMRSRFRGVFASVNRNKRSIVVNLKDEEDRQLLQSKIGEFDVVIEGFRPGVAARLGIDYGRLSLLNPRLVYCAISGFGQEGPYSSWPGHDINYVSISPAIWFSGGVEGPPDWNVGIPVADVLSGQFAALSVLAALKEREMSGQGQYIDLAMSDVVLAACDIRLQEYVGKGRPDRSVQMARSSFGIFTCADGLQVAVGAIEEKFWLELCRLLDLPDLEQDPGLLDFEARNERWREVRSRIAAALMEEPREFWLQKADQNSLPITPVHKPEDALSDPQFQQRGLIRTAGDGGFSMGLPAIFSRMPRREAGEAPKLGEHTQEFRSLGAQHPSREST